MDQSSSGGNKPKRRKRPSSSEYIISKLKGLQVGGIGRPSEGPGLRRATLPPDYAISVSGEIKSQNSESQDMNAPESHQEKTEHAAHEAPSGEALGLNEAIANASLGTGGKVESAWMHPSDANQNEASKEPASRIIQIDEGGIAPPIKPNTPASDKHPSRITQPLGVSAGATPIDKPHALEVLEEPNASKKHQSEPPPVNRFEVKSEEALSVFKAQGPLAERVASPLQPRSTLVQEVTIPPKIHVVRENSRPSDGRLHLILDPESQVSATFRVLRHRLLERGNPKRIVVTSAKAGEGKTTCAVNLAMALSEFNRARVLLLEANFRQPCISQMMGFSHSVCLVKQLIQHQQEPMSSWSVIEARWPGLHVLPVGTDYQQETSMIDWPTLENAIEKLGHADYDYVVIDTPPVLGTADVNFVQETADRVLFTVWGGRSRAKDLQLAIDQLTPEKVVGVVMLNG